MNLDKPYVRVTECTERWCCDINKDLVGDKTSPFIRHIGHQIAYCKHCGRKYNLESYIDAAGSRDWDYVEVEDELRPASGEGPPQTLLSERKV